MPVYVTSFNEDTPWGRCVLSDHTVDLSPTVPHRHLWADYLENVEDSKSHNPMGLLQDSFTYFFTFACSPSKGRVVPVLN
jgi:hypothetical protein